MTDKERIDKFLSLFKKLEKELIALSKIRDSEHVSFSRALNKVHYDKLNPIIASQDNYDFLRTCSDVRNLLSHEENTVIPTDSFIQQFMKIIDSILNPLSCYDICTKHVYVCNFRQPISQIMSVMDEKKLSHVPIVDSNGIVQGVFSRETFFDIILSNKEITVNDELTVWDFYKECLFEGHTNEAYLFVSKNYSTKKAFDALVKRSSQKKKPVLLFVTEHGKQEEHLLGVITYLDLTKINAES